MPRLWGAFISTKRNLAIAMRDSWDKYFMEIARVTARRSTCDRAQVGCVIVRDKMILATGYNGSPRTWPHCDDVGHLLVNNHCVRTVHAEANAIAAAARNGVSLKSEGYTATVAYMTISPCFNCYMLLKQAGITSIIYGEAYRIDELSELVVEACGGPQVCMSPFNNPALRKV
jgi:dCMP deaminase